MPRDNLGRQHYVCICGQECVLGDKEIFAWKIAHSEYCRTEDINKQSTLTKCDVSDCKICYPPNRG